MSDRATTARNPGTNPLAAGQAVERVRTSLRKPFDLSSTYRWLTLVGLALGLFISMEWQAPVARAPVSADYPRELDRETVKRLEAEQKDLKLVISDLRSELTTLQTDTASRKSALAGLNSELESQRIQAGTIPLAGAGVQVVLDDSNAKSIPSGDDAASYIVHDYDLRDVVSILWQSGAEAIAIGGERVVSSTSIYCVGSTILVNDTRMSPPYRVVALGPGSSMEEALNSPASLQKLKQNARQYGVQLKISQGKDLQVPAFSGRFSTRFAQPDGVY